MPHIHRLFLLPATVVLLMMACEEPFEFDLDDQERLVIYSNFSDLQTLEVYVSKTRSVLSNAPTTFLEDATVMVFSGSQLIEILEPVPANAPEANPPFYRTLKLKPEVGVVYTIKVTAPGFEPVTATNTIPVSVPIESVDFSSSLQSDLINNQKVEFNVNVTFQDPIDQENFYHIIFSQQLQPYSLNDNGDTLLAEKLIIASMKAYPSDPDMPVTPHYDERSYLVKDQTFNGENISFPFWGFYTYDPSKFLPGDFTIELRTVSEAYYYYHITVSRQINSHNPMSDGVVVYDNVENGEGIFAGYSSSFNSIKLSN